MHWLWKPVRSTLWHSELPSRHPSGWNFDEDSLKKFRILYSKLPFFVVKEKRRRRKLGLGASLAVQSSGQDSALPVQETQVWSLIKELRSHILHSVAKKTKKKYLGWFFLKGVGIISGQSILTFKHLWNKVFPPRGGNVLDILKYCGCQVTYSWEFQRDLFWNFTKFFLILMCKNKQIKIVNNILQEKNHEERINLIRYDLIIKQYGWYWLKIGWSIGEKTMDSSIAFSYYNTLNSYSLVFHRFFFFFPFHFYGF